MKKPTKANSRLSRRPTAETQEFGREPTFTQPPARFTEATLIKALEENGIGRPSTYATIISTIIKRQYVVRSAKLLSPTESARPRTGLLKDRFPKIVNTKFTAQMETSLDEVERGNED
jgi:DNA topoisomerase-1